MEKCCFCPASPQPAQSDLAPRRPVAVPPSAGERGRLRDGHGAAAEAGGRESGHGRRGKARREESQALSGVSLPWGATAAAGRGRQRGALHDCPSVTVPQKGPLKEGPSVTVRQKMSLKDGPSVRVLE